MSVPADLLATIKAIGCRSCAESLHPSAPGHQELLYFFCQLGARGSRQEIVESGFDLQNLRLRKFLGWIENLQRSWPGCFLQNLRLTNILIKNENLRRRSRKSLCSISRNSNFFVESRDSSPVNRCSAGMPFFKILDNRQKFCISKILMTGELLYRGYFLRLIMVFHENEDFGNLYRDWIGVTALL